MLGPEESYETEKKLRRRIFCALRPIALVALITGFADRAFGLGRLDKVLLLSCGDNLHRAVAQLLAKRRVLGVGGVFHVRRNEFVKRP